MILEKHKSGEELHYDGVDNGKERKRGIGHTEATEDEKIQIWSDNVKKDANRIICLKLNN
jgi:hypothetical protein